MPIERIDGLDVRYEVHGNGPPLLMMAPGGFDATLDKWSAAGVWKTLRPLDALANDFTLIAYDRREAGRSGGRVEPLSWKLYAKQARDLLDHLGVGRAFVLGGCMGCSVAAAFAVDYPARTLGLILHWPVGGHGWREIGRQRFDGHIDLVRRQGLGAAIDRARAAGSFWADPEAGPWASVIARDHDFADAFAQQPVARYLGIVTVSRNALFPDDQPTGVTPEELMGLSLRTLIIGGNDEVHTRSAAWTMHELIPGAEIAPSFPPEQNAELVTAWIRQFVATGRRS